MTPSRSPRRGDPGQGLLGGQPHRAGDDLDRLHGEAALAQAGAVQVEPRDAEPGRDRDRLLGGGQQLVGAVGVGEVAP